MTVIAADPRFAAVDPGDAKGWGALGDRLRLAGETAAADQAYARQIRATVVAPDQVAAAGSKP